MDSSQTHPAHLQAPICRNPGCGKPFIPKRPWQRFCHPSCRRAFHAGPVVDTRRIDELEKRVAELERKVDVLSPPEGL